MAYEKTTWVDGETEIDAQKLNKMEQGIVEASKSSVVDTFNVEDKTTNAPSIRAVEDKLSYSLEEKHIGYWVDGKPLYRRTYTSYEKQTGENLEYYIFDTDTNKNMKKAEGILIIKFGENYYESVIGSGGIDFGASEFSSNKQSGAIYATRQVPSNIQYATVGLEVTIEYTKNTD